MGTSLASVQVHLDNKAPTRLRAKAIKALRNYVLTGPFVETSQDQDYDRAIFIGPFNRQTPWLTIFDTNGDLRDVAKYVSAVIEGTVIFINLIDSDVIHLRRYTNGLVVDDYCNVPEIYDDYTSGSNWLSDWNELDNSQLQLLKSGNVSKWQDLFIERVNTIDLQNIWKSKPVFADDILWATVDALGMNDQEIFSMGRDETFTRLTFRSKEARQYEIKAEGLPKFDLHSYGILEEVHLGDNIDISISIRNDGGKANGLNIVAGGNALDKKLISLDQVKIYSGTKKDGELEGNFVLQDGSLDDHHSAIYTVSFPDFEIPEGIPNALNAQNQPEVDWHKAFTAINQTLIHVWLSVEVETEGQGNLFVAFVPQENKRDGYSVYQTEIYAKPAPRRPLRYQNAGRPIPSVLLADLERPSDFFVLMSLDAERRQSAKIVSEVIETWIKEKTQSPKDTFVTNLRTQVNLMPDEKKLFAKQIPNGVRWKTIRDALETCVSFSITHDSMSIAYDANPLFFQTSGELLTPHLFFLLPVENSTTEGLMRWEEWSTKVVNGLLQRKLILQAIMGRWRWRGEGQQIDATPYETATGIGGSCTTAQFWCKRFLRGVTEHLWLGPDLVERLGEINTLTSIAHVDLIGNGVSIELRKEHSLSELENLLAPLLPSEQDWRGSMQKLYPRNNGSLK